MQYYVVTIPTPAAAIALLPAIGAEDQAISALILQPRGANAAKIYIGGPTVSATDYALAVNPGSGGNPPAPIILSSPHSSLGMLSSVYAFGTAGEILHVTVVPR